MVKVLGNASKYSTISVIQRIKIKEPQVDLVTEEKEHHLPHPTLPTNKRTKHSIPHFNISNE